MRKSNPVPESVWRGELPRAQRRRSSALHRENSGSSRGIDRIDQLTEAPEPGAKRRKDQPGQTPNLRLIFLLRQRRALDDLPFADDIGELLVKSDNRHLRQAMI